MNKGGDLHFKIMKDSGYDQFQKFQLRLFANRAYPKGSFEFLSNSWHCSDNLHNFWREKQLVQRAASLHNLCTFVMDPINIRKFLNAAI